MKSVHAGAEWNYGNFNFFGLSLSGIRTSIAMPQLDLAFDVAQGLPFVLRQKKFFITHGHLDHAAGIPYIISQKALLNEPAPKFYMPPSLVEPLHEIIHLWEKIEGHHYTYEFHPVMEGADIDLHQGAFIRPFRTVHRIESFGYTLFHRNKKLKPALQELHSNEIKQRSLRGEEVSTLIESPQVSFTGDTQIDFLERNPWLAQTKIFFIECTYLDDKKSIEHARKWGHIHLDELIPKLDSLQCERIVLIHLSSRYSMKESEDILKKKIPLRHQERVVIFPGQ